MCSRRLCIVLGIALSLVWAGMARGQITRDVGHVAVIEADSNILFPIEDDNDVTCALSGVDMDEVTKKFYQTHANDEYDFIIVLTTFDFLIYPVNCVETAAGLYVPVSNDVSGIGTTIYDTSGSYGSAPGVLRGTIHLGNVNDLSATPNLGTLSQEVAHRWGAFVRFDSDPSAARAPSMDLLGRDGSHWSFFLNSASATSSPSNTRGSGLDGNYWAPNGTGFQTQTLGRGYSELDLYLMGLLPADEVDSFWYLRDPIGPIGANSPPVSGYTTSGTQTFVTIDDVIEVEGPRSPGFGASPRIFRQAFVLVTPPGVDASAAEIARVDDYRRAWESFFTRETQNRGAVTTQLWGLAFADAQAVGSEKDGSLEEPYQTIVEGLNGTPDGGTLVLQPGDYPSAGTIAHPVTLRAVLGPARIGN